MFTAEQLLDLQRRELARELDRRTPLRSDCPHGVAVPVGRSALWCPHCGAIALDLPEGSVPVWFAPGVR